MLSASSVLVMTSCGRLARAGYQQQRRAEECGKQHYRNSNGRPTASEHQLRYCGVIEDSAAHVRELGMRGMQPGVGIGWFLPALWPPLLAMSIAGQVPCRRRVLVAHPTCQIRGQVTMAPCSPRSTLPLASLCSQGVDGEGQPRERSIVLTSKKLASTRYTRAISVFGWRRCEVSLDLAVRQSIY
jgi:hypothetical protein